MEFLASLEIDNRYFYQLKNTFLLTFASPCLSSVSEFVLIRLSIPRVREECLRRRSDPVLLLAGTFSFSGVIASCFMGSKLAAGGVFIFPPISSHFMTGAELHRSTFSSDIKIPFLKGSNVRLPNV